MEYKRKQFEEVLNRINEPRGRTLAELCKGFADRAFHIQRHIDGYKDYETTIAPPII